jgi:hypothetical protein
VVDADGGYELGGDGEIVLVEDLLDQASSGILRSSGDIAA